MDIYQPLIVIYMVGSHLWHEFMISIKHLLKDTSHIANINKIIKGLFYRSHCKKNSIEDLNKATTKKPSERSKQSNY